MTRTDLLKPAFIILTLLLSGSLLAQKDYFFETKNGAIKGYDPVAYFKDGKSVKGSPDLSVEWKETTWHFSSEENKKAFQADPERYIPEFGGYCAYAVSQGYTYRADPEVWKIVDGKLYLNYSPKIQKKWEANESELIRKGKENWPKVVE